LNGMIDGSLEFGEGGMKGFIVLNPKINKNKK
jgi:hypothetical protein